MDFACSRRWDARFLRRCSAGNPILAVGRWERPTVLKDGIAHLILRKLIEIVNDNYKRAKTKEKLEKMRGKTTNDS